MAVSHEADATRCARVAAQLLGKVLPAAAGVEHAQDPFERGAVVDPGRLPGPRGAGRCGINGSISSQSVRDQPLLHALRHDRGRSTINRSRSATRPSFETRSKYRFCKLDALNPRVLHRRWLRWAADERQQSPWTGAIMIPVADLPPGPPQPSLVPEAVIPEPFPSIHHLLPSRNIGNLITGTLNFSPSKIARLLELGEIDANELLNNLRNTPARPHTSRDIDEIPQFTGWADRLMFVVRALIKRRLPRWYSAHDYWT